MAKFFLSKEYDVLKPFKTNNLIRVGSKQDGGYIVDSKILDNFNTLISFGLGDGTNTTNLPWSFEDELLKKKEDLHIHVYDYTALPSSYYSRISKNLRRFLTFRATFEELKRSIICFLKYKNFINSKKVTLFKEKITYPIKDNIDSDIHKVFSRIKKDARIILKCDIEGSEYDIINQIIEHADRIEMLILEFHWIDKKKAIFLESIKKLNKNFYIIHIHGNNHSGVLEGGLPMVQEITLINKKNYLDKIEYSTDFPIKGLDYPCNPNIDDISFSFEK